MIILATGVSGSGKLQYFKEVKALAEKNETSIKIYSIGDLLFKLAREAGEKLNKENILNMPTPALIGYVQAVYERIEREIQPKDSAILNTHALFFWRRLWIDSKNARFLDKIKPDKYISVIDSPQTIQANLSSNSQWKTQKLTQEEVNQWQSLETLVTSEYWAGVRNKDYIALPRNQPADEVLKLFIEPSITKAYCSFPMTHLKNPEESNKRIDDFIKRLRQYAVVIDPRAIELDLKEVSEVGKNHTVYRDLDLFVRFTDMTVCYYPELVFSTGAVSEAVRAHDTTKDVYHVINVENRSPFTDYNSKAVYLTEDEFFAEVFEKKGCKKFNFAK